MQIFHLLMANLKPQLNMVYWTPCNRGKETLEMLKKKK